MELVPTVDPIPAKPLAYPVRDNRERAADVMRADSAGTTPTADHECDAKQCRVVIGAARRDIDPLRRPQPQPPHADVFEPDPKASPPAEPKSYAPDPPGKAPERREELPPDEAPPVRVFSRFHVINVGSIVDVLA